MSEKQTKQERVARLKEQLSSSLLHFTCLVMTDSDDGKFQVPTRGNRIIGLPPKFQQLIFDKLNKIKTIKRLALASPRGFTKSTTCSIMFPLQAAAFKNFENILIVSNSEALSIHLIRQIRMNIEDNQMLKTLVGDLTSAKWTETHLILKNGVNIRGCGWGAQIRGFRPDLIIIDDFESDETVRSEDMRMKMREWLNKALINSLTPDGCVVFIGTIISRLSILFDYINHAPEGWEAVFNQAYKNGVEERGMELWPEIWPHERLQSRKSEIGSWAFSSEFMNDPMPSEGNRFSTSTFRYFTNDDIKGKALGEYVAIDPAFSSEGSADYGVILNLLHDSEDNAYVDTYYRDKTTSGKLIERFKAMYKARRDKIRAVGVEANGPQRAFYDRLVEECMRDGLFPPFKKLTANINGVRNKIDRVTYVLQPRLEAGKLHFRRDQSALIQELMLFPESKHDDLSDALAYGCSLLESMMNYDQEQGSFSFENELEPVGIDRGTTGYGEMYGT